VNPPEVEEGRFDPFIFIDRNQKFARHGCFWLHIESYFFWHAIQYILFFSLTQHVLQSDKADFLIEVI